MADETHTPDEESTVKRRGRLGLPGARPREEALESMIRVDHAGEYGAVRIYEGQLAVLGKRPGSRRAVELIRHMHEQEQEHLTTFDRLVNERRVRPTLMNPVWNVAGYTLGAVTALMGEKAAMACTAAVEEVIDEHYARQERALDDGTDPEFHEVISKFRADEAKHRDTALQEGAERAPGYPLLSAAIKAGCRLAIRISERV
jgi:3-demethoxyubiquinol 3-hydroxylase